MSATLLPFLYLTKTLQRTPRFLPVNQFSRLLHASSIPCSRFQAPKATRAKDDAHSIPFEWEDGRDGEEVGDSSTGSITKGTSTITPIERQIFDDIFHDIARRGKVPKPGKSAPMSSANGSQIHDAQAAVRFIIQDSAVATKQMAAPISATPVDQVRNAKNRDQILLKYPPSLRRAAETALGMHKITDGQAGTTNFAIPKGEADSQEFHEKILLHSKWEQKRQAEQRRVEEIMVNCETDFELWEVMEKEVFSMVDRLGITEEDDVKIPGNRPKKTEGHVKTDLVDRKLNMDIHGPRYSIHLLKGLKLFDEHFAGPSQLSLRMLPRIKELGLASFVLGVSTPFYNKLMDIYWTRHGDITGVLAILEEMEIAGLYFDQMTLAVLHKIQSAFDSCGDAQNGHFARTILDMPEYDSSVRSKVKQWQRRVGISYSRRQKELNY
jgi:hypothetical protein